MSLSALLLFSVAIVVISSASVSEATVIVNGVRVPGEKLVVNDQIHHNPVSNVSSIDLKMNWVLPDQLTRFEVLDDTPKGKKPARVSVNLNNGKTLDVTFESVLGEGIYYNIKIYSL